MRELLVKGGPDVAAKVAEAIKGHNSVDLRYVLERTLNIFHTEMREERTGRGREGETQPVKCLGLLDYLVQNGAKSRTAQWYLVLCLSCVVCCVSLVKCDWSGGEPDPRGGTAGPRRGTPGENIHIM